MPSDDPPSSRGPWWLLTPVLVALLALGGAAGSSERRDEATTPAQSAATLTTLDAEAWLDGLVPAAMEREQIAGGVVVVVHDGEVVTERGYGLADTGTGDGTPSAVDPGSTLFRIGSVSKLVTATAVLQLVEDGRLDLDEPVQTYLDFDLPTRFDAPVTLRHLLSHTAGFEDRIAGVIGDPDLAAPALRDVVSTDVPHQIFEPGTTPAYSNYGNALAAYVVEAVSATEFSDYATEHVFRRAGMTTATFDQPLSGQARGAVSRGYDTSHSDEVPFEMVGPAPAGAVSASARDMSAFMLAQLGHGDEPLLRPATRELMQTPALDADSLGGLANGPRMTLGYFQRDRNGHRILGHGGDLTAFHTQLDIYPDDDTAIYVALNSTGSSSDSTTALRDAVTNGFADRYFPDQDPSPEPTETATAHADRVAGTYQLSRRTESTFVRLFFIISAVTVESGGDGTMRISAVTDTSGTPVDLVEVEPWVWQEVGGQRRVAVDQVDGDVVAVGFDPAFTLQPMPAHRAALPLVAAVSVGILVLHLLGSVASLLPRVLRHPLRRFPGRRPRTAEAAGASAAGTVRAVHESRTSRTTRGLVLAAICSLALAGALWAVTATALLNDAPPPGWVIIRGAQALTALALLGVAPAAWRVVEAVRHPGTQRTPRRPLTLVLRALLAAAFAGLAYTVVVGGLLQPSISY